MQNTLFREGGKLLRALAYVPRCNAKPASIRVTLQHADKANKIKAKETMFSVESKPFSEQYQRAVAALADYRGIAADDPVRAKMEATSAEFLRHYNLRTKTVTYEVLVPNEQPSTGETQ